MSTTSGTITLSEGARKNCALYKGGTWTVPDDSNVIGNEASGSYPAGETAGLRRWRIERYSFTVPSTINSQRVVSAYIKSIVFNSKGSGYYVMPSNSNGEIKDVRYLISTKDSMELGDLNKGTSMGAVSNIQNQRSITVSPGVSLAPGTYYIFVFSNADGTYGWRQWDAYPEYLSINVDYTTTTPCGAPTEFKIKNFSGQYYYVKPEMGQTLSFTWKAGTDGTNNKISGYRIYYRYGAAPLVNNYDGYINVEGNQTSRSHGFNFSGVARGQYVYFSIQTKGEAGASYYSSLVSASSVVQINTLPSSPSVSCSTTILPSSGKGEVKITGLSASDTTHSTMTYYYSTNTNFNNATPVTLGSSININITSNAQIYYFWAYDGLESSAKYSSITFTKNTAPEFELYVSGEELASSNKTSGQKYITTPTITAKITDAQKKESANVTFFVDFSPYLDFAGFRTITLNTMELSISDASFKKNLQLSLLPLEKNGCYYRIRAVRKDGVEEVSKTSSTYYLTRIPKLTGIFNKDCRSNVEGLENYFSKKLYLQFEYDEGFKQARPKTTNKTGPALINLIPDEVDTSKMYLDASSWASSESVFSQGSASEFLGQFYLDGYYVNCNYDTSLTNRINRTRTKIYYINSSNFKNLVLNGPVKPFSDKIDYAMSISKPGTKEYGVASWKSGNFKYTNIVNSTTTSASKSINEITEDNNALSLSLDGGSLRTDIIEKFAPDKRTTTYSAYPKLTITNDFGDLANITGASYTVDFREQPVIKSFNIYADNVALESAEFIMEDVNLTCSGTILSYNIRPKCQIQIRRTINNITQDWENYGSSFQLTGPSEYEYTFDKKYFAKVGQLAINQYEAEFQLVVVNDAGQKSTSKDEGFNFPIECRGIIPGEVELISAEYKTISTDPDHGDQKGITISYEIKDYGALPPIDVPAFSISGTYLQEEECELEYIKNGQSKEGWESQDISLNNGEASTTIDFENFNYVTIRLATKMALHNKTLNKTVYKTTYSNLFTIYDSMPTVSYRQNHVGINTKVFGNQNTVLDVSAYDDKKLIYLRGYDDDTQTEHVICIDLLQGTAEGLVININGGTWS